VVPGAALGIQEAEKVLESVSVRSIPEEGALATDGDEFLISELVQVMGKRGIGNLEFGLDVSDHHALWLGRHKKLHDAQPRFGAHRGEHISIAGDLGCREARHISILLEI